MKGQQKIARGSDFGGAFKYIMDHDDPKFIAGTICRGTVKQMVSEFKALAGLRADVEKPVWMNSLRLPEGDHLEDSVWANIAADYMLEMGFQQSAQWVTIKHHKPEGEHVHIIANRVMIDSTLYLGQQENFVSTQIIAKLERTYNLTITKGVSYNEDGTIKRPDYAPLTKKEIEKSVRTGLDPERKQLQDRIDLVLSEGMMSIVDFVKKLESQGVSVFSNFKRTNEMNGFSFKLQDGELNFSGSKLGNKFKWSTLISGNLDFNESSDLDYLRLLAV